MEMSKMPTYNLLVEQMFDISIIFWINIVGG